MEMTVALGVIGILSMVAVPYSLEWRQISKLNYVSQEVLFDMFEAKSLAIVKGQRVIITFDLDNNLYQTYLDSNGLEIDISNLIETRRIASIDPAVKLDIMSPVGVDGTELPTAVHFGSTSTPIRCTFHPNGTAVNSGGIYLSLVGDTESKNQRAIKVESTGNITRWTYDNEEISIPWREYVYQ